MAKNTLKTTTNPNHQDFFWPYNHQDIQKRINLWVQDLCALAFEIQKTQSDQKTKLNGGALILVNILKWQPVMVQAMQTLILKQGFEKAEKNPLIDPQTMPLWQRYVHTDLPLEDGRYLKALFKGPPTEPLWKTTLKYARDCIENRPIITKPSTFYNPNKDLTLTVSCPAAQIYCEDLKKRGVYMGLEHWFSGVREQDIGARKDPVIEQVLEITWKHLRAVCVLEPRMQNWVERQIRLSYHITDILAETVMKAPSRLPKQLIAGITAPWAILFRYLVHKNGGDVIVFDHGAGAVLSFPTTTYLNYVLGSTAFYTYTSYAAAHYKNKIERHTPFSDNQTRIEGHKALRPVNHDTANQHASIANKKIMLIPFYDMRDYNLSYGYPAWRPALDFNQNLVSRLKTLGYDIALKFHPEFYIAPDAELRKLYGECHIIREPFEHVMDQYQSIVTCDANSSTFISIVLKNKPCIVFDFLNLSDGALKKDMRQRLEVIPVTVSPDNRLIQQDPISEIHFKRAREKAKSQALKALYL
ncbi:MAG: hypothetical protein ACPGRX_01695 [Bdellovibrionales bacterium]